MKLLTEALWVFVLFSFIGKKRGDTEPLAFVLSFVKRRRES